MLSPKPDAITWHAKLNLHFRQSHGETVMSDNSHTGPLRVQRTFHEADNSRHVYILHPPGGYVAGDVIDISVTTEHEAHVVTTSPGAAKFYRCKADTPLNQTQSLALTAKDSSLLEWLPQETILFRDANAKLHTNIQLDPEASFLGWEISCLGRTASGEDFGAGKLDQSLNLYRDGLLLHREKIHLTPGDDIFNRPWGLDALPVFGTFVAAIHLTDNNKSNKLQYHQQDQLMQAVESCRAILTDFGDARCWSATTKAGIILVRYLGTNSETCKLGFERIRETLLSTYRHIEAARPRIWAT